jgi:hypothetical protein
MLNAFQVSLIYLDVARVLLVVCIIILITLYLLMIFIMVNIWCFSWQFIRFSSYDLHCPKSTWFSVKVIICLCQLFMPISNGSS